MKKFLFITILFAVLSANVYASELTAQQSHAIDVLKKIEIVEREPGYDYNCKLTRRECIKYICSLSGGLYIMPDDEIISEEYFGVPDFCDIQSGTEDCSIVVTAYIKGVLKGKISSDGKIMADMDSYVTWKEAITMIDRLFVSDNYYGDLTDDLWWYNYACDTGIINNYTDYNVYNVFQLNADDADNCVTEADFLYVLYSAMHTPKHINTYQGDITFFYIDNFIK